MFCKDFKFLLGVIKIRLIIEDRGSEDISRNLKHQVIIDVLGKRVFSHIVRSSTKGITIVNGKELYENI